MCLFIAAGEGVNSPAELWLQMSLTSLIRKECKTYPQYQLLPLKKEGESEETLVGRVKL